MQHHGFLSYSRKDSDIMQRVRDELRGAGLTVWTDEGIEPGTPLWKDAIESAIENAGCMIVILSPDAKKSIWVKRELEYAEAQEKHIFPLLVRGDKNDAIPFTLIGAQFVDIRNDQAKQINSLVLAIRKHLSIEERFSQQPAKYELQYSSQSSQYDPNWTVLNSRYRLVEQIGSGGMGVIYKGIDLFLDRTVALKILRPSLTTNNAYLDRFRSEARNLAKLVHPNIVSIHDVGNEGPTHYVAMEFIDGRDLRLIMRDVGTLTVEHTLTIMTQVCAGIGFAHHFNLFHTNIKPHNIMVTGDEIVKVIDFGMAQPLYEKSSGKGKAILATPSYFAPEQAKGLEPSPASDVYSIGVVMFQMLTGSLPYRGSSQKELAQAHIHEHVPIVADIDPNIPVELSRIIYTAMSKDARDRYPTANELGEALADFAAK
jgi:serine/threonine-protein kinase